MTLSPFQKAPILVRLRSLPWGRYVLIALGLSFLVAVVLLPLVAIFYQAFAAGILDYWQSITLPESLHALWLTLGIVLIAVPLNMGFGILIAWILTRHPIPGKVFLLGLVDLPLAISPTIVGLMFILLYSHTVGIFGSWLEAIHLKIIFAFPSMVLTTLFVTFPFVIRELIPVLQNAGTEEEEAAETLGANPWQIFWRITFPSIRWALLYGVILCTSRAIGEFGAVSVVSGKLIGETNTLTLHIERAYTEYESTTAFASASLLALLAVLTLVGQEWLRSLGPGKLPGSPQKH